MSKLTKVLISIIGDYVFFIMAISLAIMIYSFITEWDTVWGFGETVDEPVE